MAAIAPRLSTDAALLRGDADAFAAFYRRHEDAVLRYFLRRVRRADVAADLTAETFAGALAGRRSFDPELGDARGWLFGIARHLLARSLERGRVEDEARRRLAMEPVVVDDAALRRIDELGRADALTSLAVLPDEQRVAIEGRVLDGDTYATLAERLECSESVVRQRVSRGLKTLRARLERTR
ncbi:RNA polymerase sigma factor [Patulibacter sp. NPDC049589]|uniref:RNA polymerase sigma factor n=1 Tax=Patulibacter sp. NPDC049589 TaxID=3154731 RepID=UPI003447DA35